MKRAKSERLKLPASSEEMKAWSAALAGEVGGWPNITPRSFFGFTALYRKDRMFVALPRTRGMRTPNSLVLKIDAPTPALCARLEKEARVGSMQMQNARWFTFELSCDADLRGALEWLVLAYEAAGKNKKAR